MTQIYFDILHQQYKVEQNIIKSSLALATIAPDLVAYNLMKGPGYMAMTAGEVIHIMKCIPMEVKVAHSNKCYMELKITYQNQTLFLTPRTHILTKRGTTVQCNPVLAF